MFKTSTNLNHISIARYGICHRYETQTIHSTFSPPKSLLYFLFFIPAWNFIKTTFDHFQLFFPRWYHIFLILHLSNYFPFGNVQKSIIKITMVVMLTHRIITQTFLEWFWTVHNMYNNIGNDFCVRWDLLWNIIKHRQHHIILLIGVYLSLNALMISYQVDYVLIVCLLYTIFFSALTQSTPITSFLSILCWWNMMLK